MAKNKNKSSGPPPYRQKQKEVQKRRRADESAQREHAAKVSSVAAQTPAPASHPWPAPRITYNGQGDYRFVNPYNFVRYLPAPTLDPAKPLSLLAGRCPPPPHDRYVGLSGTIRCQLEVVTPLFVADSEDVRVTLYRDAAGQLREHLHYRFFQIDGQEMIPATSLRGAIRSLFEAITNSCFSVFEGERRLDYRDVDKAKEMVPAIVTKIPQTPEDVGEVALCKSARIPAYHRDETKNRITPENWSCGEKGYTVVSGGRAPKVKEWVVKDRAIYANHPDGVTEGWVKITGQTIDGKVNEQFFFYDKDEGKAPKKPFTWRQMEDYNEILHDQLTDQTRQFKTQVQHNQLTSGDLVYVRLNDDKSAVTDISPVKVPRLRFEDGLKEFIPEHLHPCKEYDALCPACRVFGWVKNAHQPGARNWDLKERTAYAGRVRFSHATLVADKDAGCSDGEIPLAILSSPKPTTSLFYLYKGDPNTAEFEVPEGDREIQYRQGYKLRGRKFYYHHGKLLNRQEFERADQRQDLQNRSVRNVRRPGNVFEFTIRFENLSLVELGALIWTLKLGENEGCHLRLGYAKPLGFGSVLVNVGSLTTMDWSSRYQSLSSAQPLSALAGSGRKLMEDAMAAFDQAMKQAYGQSVSDLPHMNELHAILQEPGEQWPPRIHYPRPPRPEQHHQPDPEGKNFEWFVGNKSGGPGRGEKRGPFHALPQVAQTESGLPLLDKNGVAYK
jgi:CRISPR-associated protein (TIGR03986 family)